MNGKLKQLGIVMLLMIAVLSMGVHALPISMDKVEVDGTTVIPSATNRLDLERGQDIDVRIELLGLGDAKDVEIMAYISGYEYNDVEKISDTTHVFDVEANVTYVKHLKLTIPTRVDQDDYKLRIVVSDRDGDELTANYRLLIDVPRHSIQVKDVILSPEQSVEPGRALLASVRVKNLGDKDEDSVKVTVSIPALGVSASDYIDTLEAGESTTSEELYMRIPDNAKSGDYSVEVTADYDEGFEKIVAERTVTVLAPQPVTPTTPAGGEPATQDKTVITLSTDMQELVSGQGGAVYPITLANQGSTTKTYVIAVDGLDSWATSRISPSNVVVVSAGDTQTVFVYVSAAPAASAGQHMFSVSVSSADKVLKQVPLKATVTAGQSATSISWDQVKKGLEIAFIILVVILVVLGLIIAFSKLREKDEPEEISGQTYY